MRAAAAILIFLAGAGSDYLLWRDGKRSSEPVVDREPAPTQSDEVTATAPEKQPPLPEDPRGLEEELARAEPEVQQRRWRRAGDGYLAVGRSDPESALYCYRRSLAHAGSSEPQPDDSWLLKYLKVSRQ